MHCYYSKAQSLIKLLMDVTDRAVKPNCTSTREIYPQNKTDAASFALVALSINPAVCYQHICATSELGLTYIFKKKYSFKSRFVQQLMNYEQVSEHVALGITFYSICRITWQYLERKNAHTSAENRDAIPGPYRTKRGRDYLNKNIAGGVHQVLFRII